MKKILYVITKSNWGGAQRYVFDLATHLPKDQFDVAVAYGMRGLLAEKLQHAGVTTHEITSMQRDVSFGADIKSFFELYRLFKTEKPDVVHLNSSKAGGVGALAARMAGVPKIIFTVHGWPFLENRNALSRGLIRFASKLTAKLSHHVIVISRFDQQLAASLGMAHKTLLIHNGIEPIDFLPRDANYEYTRVLTNAELTPNKNLFTAIDAVIAAKDAGAQITYSIMSDGELREPLRQYIEKRGAGEYILLLGFVPDGRHHYKNFDIFFLPSYKEGVPYVLLEAGMAALPVVASNVGGIPEVIEDGVSGILKAPTDTAAFTEALVTLFKSKELRQSMADKLKEKVQKDFSLERTVRQTIGLY